MTTNRASTRTTPPPRIRPPPSDRPRWVDRGWGGAPRRSRRRHNTGSTPTPASHPPRPSGPCPATHPGARSDHRRPTTFGSAPRASAGPVPGGRRGHGRDRRRGGAAVGGAGLRWHVPAVAGRWPPGPRPRLGGRGPGDPSQPMTITEDSAITAAAEAVSPAVVTITSAGGTAGSGHEHVITCPPPASARASSSTRAAGS